MVNKEVIKTKIDCCFADKIYMLYQNKRYGINNCLMPLNSTISDLYQLKMIYNHYYDTYPNSFCTDATIYEPCCIDGCNISTIIEKINRL